MSEHGERAPSAVTGRVIHVSLDLLDRQLRDRDGVECGKVDDLEVTIDDDGGWWLTAILTGPGTLWYRLGRRRLGSWLGRTRAASDPQRTGRIPLHLAATIGASVDLAVDRHDLATFGAEHWVGDHVIGHIPGSAHDAHQ